MNNFGFMETDVANVMMFMLLDPNESDFEFVAREYTGTDTGGGGGMGVSKAFVIGMALTRITVTTNQKWSMHML